MILGKPLSGSFSRIWNSLHFTKPSKTIVFSGMKRHGCVMGSTVNSQPQAEVSGVGPSFAFSVASALPQELESFFVSTGGQEFSESHFLIFQQKLLSVHELAEHFCEQCKFVPVEVTLTTDGVHGLRERLFKSYRGSPAFLVRYLEGNRRNGILLYEF